MNTTDFVPVKGSAGNCQEKDGEGVSGNLDWPSIRKILLTEWFCNKSRFDNTTIDAGSSEALLTTICAFEGKGAAGVEINRAASMIAASMIYKFYVSYPAVNQKLLSPLCRFLPEYFFFVYILLAMRSFTS